MMTAQPIRAQAQARSAAGPALHSALAFAVWMAWPVVVAQMPAAGYRFGINQLFWLAALPALSGATLRFIEAATAPAGERVGLRAASSALLLAALLAMGYAARQPTTAFELLVLLALLCGLGVARVVGALVPTRHAASAADEDFAHEAVVVTRRQSWFLSWLFVGTFGSTLGFAVAAPLLLTRQLAGIDIPLPLLVGLPPLALAACLLARAAGGRLAERLGAGRLTLWSFALLLAAVAGLLPALAPARQALGGEAIGLALTLALIFLASGLGQGAVLRMIPRVFAQEGGSAGDEAQAALRFAGTVGAYGGFVVPKALGSSLVLGDSLAAACWLFIAFYLSCAAIAWWHYGRRFAAHPC